MPAGRRQQTNVMLYTLLTFVGLFLIVLVAAIICYVKFEDQKKIANTAKSTLNEVATDTELRKIGTIVGTKEPRKSRLGTMVDYLDRMVQLIMAGPLEEASAEVKVENVNRKAKQTLEMLTQQYPDIEVADSNTTGLVRIIEKLKTELDNTTNQAATLGKQLSELQNRFDDAMAANFETQQNILAEKEAYYQRVKDIEKRYNDLKAMVEQTSEERVKNLMDKLQEVSDDYDGLNQTLLKTQAELNIAKNRLSYTQQKLEKIVPSPDTEVEAYEPDGKIIMIDYPNKIVYVNIGSDNHVYRGLTFQVYDKNAPIPKDGKGKAEIEVFSVNKKISAARITVSEIKRPIVVDDIVANLIWDSDKKNKFVIAGAFDLNGDGIINYGAIDRIKGLIGKWGAEVTDTVSSTTDFVILGDQPKFRPRPTFEESEVDPLAMQKHKASIERRARYQEVLAQAQALSIPVFNYERFLYFIGYKGQSDEPGAF